MLWKEILIRYGELTTKGRNRKDFIQQLKRNIKYIFSDLGSLTIRAERDRMHIELNNEEQFEVLMEKLPRVFGIQSFSPVAICEKDMGSIQQLAQKIMDRYKDQQITFKVEVHRSDKSFPYQTYDIQKAVGGYLLKNNPNLSVDVKNPDVELRVEIRKEAAYLMSEVIYGAGGMPVGSNGKTLLLLSGGIDSPVAGYLMMKRGVRIDAIHFYSPPYTSEQSLQKVKDLANELTKFGSTIRLHVIPFTELQVLIKDTVPPEMLMTTTRRIMMKIADKVREEIGALALVTGESLGQVASQTLESLTAINAVTNTPILRPLISFDKLEIIKIAQQIGTYEISIKPYEDCCTIFTPANPKTKPKIERVVHFESQTDFDEYIERAVKNREIYTFPEKQQTADKFKHLL
ncbi:tRNA uracil 4-sulfurtransferase ThiI [Ureibacillus sp. FSL K6-8385]|uniref:Probable tRNA sulfurtransferase n=1 Tax=Ureibacillus terrenus TaxID=118246 RepID=A0A540V0G0_9BACL|nr:tRNA uracil 4-sulfurtransferase ThiI [Ureibacillus terrenus]MED3662543.1 tRNA 4-thiouridine(8) synthase ThiI [Ureibacillus terrenus]MED3764809.1 tRNA 4-thiouridine(8) synthase ThiI [Ureibacillus terrenus]TQE90208.1 tRNA 4-thiouridine(8) synthase ThiI [Ureibacillus terrenus]